MAQTSPKFPSIQKPWTLFVFPGDTNSEKAAQIAARARSSVGVQDIQLLDVLPPYVDGVPVLANEKQKAAYKGSYCLNQLEELASRELSPAPVANGFSRDIGMGHARSFENGGAIDTGFSRPGIDVEAAPILDKRMNEEDVSAYMTRRSKVTDAAVQAAKQKSEAMPVGATRAPPGVRVSHQKHVATLAMESGSG